MPWGQRDTPIREILQTLKKNHWAIPVGIEFEYNVPLVLRGTPRSPSACSTDATRSRDIHRATDANAR